MQTIYIVCRWFMALYRRLRHEMPPESPLELSPEFSPESPDYLAATSSSPVFPFSRQKLNGVEAALYELQHQAAGLVFTFLGTEYIPDRLEQLLHRYDFGYALFDFTRRLGARLDVLLDIHDSNHEETKERFLRGVGFVHRVEEKAKTTSLDPDPLFETLSEHLESAESLFELYEQSAGLHQLLEKTDIAFPLYCSFRAELLGSMKNWHRLSVIDITEADKVLQGFKQLTKVYDEVNERIDAVSVWLQKQIDTLGELNYVALQIDDEVKLTRQNILSGLCRPDEGTSKLFELLYDLRAIANKIGFEGEDLRTRYSKVLGIPAGATRKEIKSAYRKLAKKVHFDRNRDDPMANQKFNRINEAYKWLWQHSPD